MKKLTALLPERHLHEGAKALANVEGALTVHLKRKPIWISVGNRLEGAQNSAKFSSLSWICLLCGFSLMCLSMVWADFAWQDWGVGSDKRGNFISMAKFMVLYAPGFLVGAYFGGQFLRILSPITMFTVLLCGAIYAAFTSPNGSGDETISLSFIFILGASTAFVQKTFLLIASLAENSQRFVWLTRLCQSLSLLLATVLINASNIVEQPPQLDRYRMHYHTYDYSKYAENRRLIEQNQSLINRCLMFLMFVPVIAGIFAVCRGWTKSVSEELKSAPIPTVAESFVCRFLSFLLWFTHFTLECVVFITFLACFHTKNVGDNFFFYCITFWLATVASASLFVRWPRFATTSKTIHFSYAILLMFCVGFHFVPSAIWTFWPAIILITFLGLFASNLPWLTAAWLHASTHPDAWTFSRRFAMAGAFGKFAAVFASDYVSTAKFYWEEHKRGGVETNFAEFEAQNLWRLATCALGVCYLLFALLWLTARRKTKAENYANFQNEENIEPIIV